jgi:hypothetical protein
MYPSDYIYYVFSGAVMKQASDATNYITPLTEGKRGDSTDTSTWMSAILGDTANRYSLFLVPDTTICGIAELCCLAATGALPIDGIYLIAFHYVMGHCWLWHTGQIKDGKPGLMAHPNFSRLLAILSQRVASQTAARVLQMSKSAVKATVAGEVDYGTDLHTNDVGAIMKAADAADNAVPWTPLLLTAGGLFLGYFLLKRWGRPENEDRDEALDELWVAAMRTSTRSYR